MCNTNTASETGKSGYCSISAAQPNCWAWGGRWRRRVSKWLSGKSDRSLSFPPVLLVRSRSSTCEDQENRGGDKAVARSGFSILFDFVFICSILSASYWRHLFSSPICVWYFCPWRSAMKPWTGCTTVKDSCQPIIPECQVHCPFITLFHTKNSPKLWEIYIITW